MKKNRNLAFFLGVMLLSAGGATAWAWSADVISDFQKANVSYREGKFKEAAAAYEKLAARYPETSVFFYNLGGALHRQKKLGPSILAYERAKLAEPRNQDALYNLNYVRGLLEYRVEDKRGWYVQAAETVLGFFTLKEVMAAAFAGFAVFASVWAFSIFFRRDEPWGWRRKALLGVFVLLAAAAAVKNIQTHFFRDAIVTAKEAQVRYGPSVNDQTAFRVGEGIKVYVVDEREGWSRVLLSNNESGWVQNGQIAEVRERKTV
jgi:tetratricopeptide (TPR) repeat protein